MAGETSPKRRPTDPVPGTRGPQRGNNDAFKVKEALQRRPDPSSPTTYEAGQWGKSREKIKSNIIDSTIDEGKPKPFKSGGMVRGWGKARKRGC